jgi:glyoxylase-like metal-dependent hydrolase (beta-lactamase superfamily II)
MRLCSGVYMVGSGQFGLSDAGDCHVYLLDGGSEMAFVDAGVGHDTERLLANVREDGLAEGKVAYILLTHAHGDHACGARTLQALTGARIACSEYEGHLLASGTLEELSLDRAMRAGVYPPDYVYAHAQPDIVLAHDQTLQVGSYTVRAIQVPGHSPGSLCYLAQGEGQRMLFCGDTVFHGGTIGLANFYGSSLEDYRRFIGRLSGLQVEALFPGHLMWTLQDGQSHLDRAVQNMESMGVPPAWQHQHFHY